MVFINTVDAKRDLLTNERVHSHEWGIHKCQLVAGLKPCLLPVLVVDFPLCNRLFSQPERFREGDRALQFVAYAHQNGTQAGRPLACCHTGPMRMPIYTTAQSIFSAAWAAGRRCVCTIAETSMRTTRDRTIWGIQRNQSTCTAAYLA